MSSSKSQSTVFVIYNPPFSFFLISMLAGFLFNLIPKPSSSLSMIFLCIKGLQASNTMMIRLQVLAVEITCLPLPFPSLAPSIIPGKSSNYILAPSIKKMIISSMFVNKISGPLCLMTPGIQVKVVNS